MNQPTAGRLRSPALLETWPLRLVGLVRGMTGDARMSAMSLSLLLFPDGEDALRAHAVSDLAERVGRYGCVIHPADVIVEVDRRIDARWSGEVLTATAHWSPATTRVRLAGGPAHGKVLTAPCLGPVLVAVPTETPPFYELDDPEAPATAFTLGHRVVEYRPTGWDAIGRTWVAATT